MGVILSLSFLPAGRARSARPAGPKITLRFPRLLVYIFVRPHYVTYIVAMRPYFQSTSAI